MGFATNELRLNRRLWLRSFDSSLLRKRWLRCFGWVPVQKRHGRCCRLAWHGLLYREAPFKPVSFVASRHRRLPINMSAGGMERGSQGSENFETELSQTNYSSLSRSDGTANFSMSTVSDIAPNVESARRVAASIELMGFATIEYCWSSPLSGIYVC